MLNERWTENGVEHLIIYVYDASGSVIGMSYRNSTSSNGIFERYLFAKNLQGDIIYIYNESGQKVVTYSYDAWGNILSITGTGASTIGAMNPFRYRGYYYDIETGLYYLNSRYYDPNTGRFINADGVISGVGEIQGYNFFVYCFNNPVNLIDNNGNWPKWLEKAAGWVDDNIVQPVKRVYNNIKEDAENYDRDNTSEADVIDAHYFSSYKGTFVVKPPIGDNAFSFGILVIGDGVILEDDVKHEYGHRVQMDNMGVGKYTVDVVIPSVTTYLLSRLGKLAPLEYYGSPWESEADLLGGVIRTKDNTPWPSGAYTSYWDLIKMFF